MNSPTFLLVALIALQLAAAAPTGSQHNSAERLDRFDELDNLGRETSEISRQVVSADDGAYIPKVAMDPNATSSTERPLLPSTTTVDSPVQHRELDDSPIKVNETTFDDYSTPPVTLSTNRPTSSVPDATTLTVASSSLSPAGSSTPRPSVSPRKKLRRSTTTTAVPPLINYSHEMDTSSSTASSDYATEASSIPPSSTAAAASARPKTRKQRKKVTKKMDVEESSTQSLELATLTINSEGTTTSRSSTSQQTESTTISFLETTTEEERVIATESPSIDEYDRGNPLATVPPATTTTTSTTTTRMEEATTEEELETSTPLEVETEFELKSTTWTPIPSTNNISAEDESITIRYQAITTSDERTTSPVATTTDRQVYVTHTPFEVSSVPENIASRGPNERLLPATTVFEDIKNSAITTTTEFISTTPELKETTTLQQFSTTPKEERTTTPHQILTTQEEEQTTTQQAAIPTSEPHVDGINVENVEESLSPIPADDVLVVEIEDSSEPAATPRASSNLDVTETVLTEEEAPQRRPKINDELFFPIGGEVGEGGDGGDDLETRDDTSDGQSNDNDGDFDLEAEIFPTIPVLKNSLFESEILREKADLVEQEQDVDDFEPVTVTQPTTRTSLAPSTSTSTSTQRPSTSSTRTSTTARAVAETTTQANVVDQNNTDFSTVSHDSDTFFYISNTEVKVVEEEDEEPSREQQPTDTELSFPENTDSEGVFVPLSDQNHSGRRVAADELSSPPLLDENIILSPVGGGGGGVGGRMGKEIKKKEPFSLVKFSAADKPHRLPDDRDDNDGGEREEQGQQDDLTKNTGSTEQLSFVRVEETTDIFSSEEAFNFLNQRRRLPLRSKEDTIPDVIIEPYPQLMDTDADLPLSIGVPVIAELPPQIKLSTSDERAAEPFAGYHHFDIDNRQVEESMDSRAAQKEIKTVRKLKKSRGGKKLAKKRLDREDQFSDIIFENAENYLVKNPAISLEVPVLDFNFTILTTSTMEPRLNFTNETTLMLEEEPIGKSGCYCIPPTQELIRNCYSHSHFRYKRPADFVPHLFYYTFTAARGGLLGFCGEVSVLAVPSRNLVAIKPSSFRFYWIKHYSYGTGLIGDNSTDLLATKSRTLSAEEVSVGDAVHPLS